MIKRLVMRLALIGLVTLATAGGCDTTEHQPCSNHYATKSVSNNGSTTVYHCVEVPGGEWQWEK